MSALAVVQVASQLAYLLLALAAVGAALRQPTQTRITVALLFGVAGAAVLLQLAQAWSAVPIPWAPSVEGVLVVSMVYLLVRLVDSFRDVPNPIRILALAAWIASAGAVAVGAGALPRATAVLLEIYLVLGLVYPSWAYVQQARVATGITRRRMTAIAAGCGILAAAILLAAIQQSERVLQGPAGALSQILTLASGMCFMAGFFPPRTLQQAWRLPELFEYLRPASLPELGADDLAAEASAMDRATAALTRSAGARRSVVAVSDPARGDLYIWGAPSLRLSLDDPLFGPVMRTRRPRFVHNLQRDEVGPTLRQIFPDGALPRSAISAPVFGDGEVIAVMTAFGDKGPIFLEDDMAVLEFFASEVAAILAERRHRETVLELAALREADRLKDEFMAVVSHELRTPLTAISGYAEILLRRISGPLTDRQERQVTAVREASQRLHALINDLLDVSKLQAGTLSLHPTAMNPGQVLEHVLREVRVIAQAKGVALQLELPPGRLPTIRADEERIGQVVANLLVNAIKFTPAGGTVTAKARVSPEDGLLELSVEDTGIGMAPHELASIWDRFYQAESSSTRRFGGVGLGLWIVKQLVELHGGTVEALSSGRGRGSTFVVHLPLNGAAPSSNASPGPPALVESTPRGPSDAPLILVVEDDADIATVLKTLLEADGYRISILTDGGGVLEAARSLQPAAVTLDVMLPDANGWDLLQALKHEPATRDIPVVVVSIIEKGDFGRALGAADYLVKPLDHERLRRVLREVAGTPKARGGTVLVVGDEPSARAAICAALAADGWTTASSASADSHLADGQQEPDLVVMDVAGSGMRPVEALDRLRAAAGTHVIPAVALISDDLSEQDATRLAARQCLLVRQGPDLNELQRIVRGTLGSRSAPRSETDESIREPSTGPTSGIAGARR